MILHHRRTWEGAVVSDQWSKGRQRHPPWEGEAPAEPKSIVSVQLSLFALNRSPVIPARTPFAHIKPRRGVRLTVAQPFRGLITTQQREASALSPCWCSVVVAWASARVITHKTRPVTSPSRCVFGLCSAYACDSGLNGRFPIAQGAALGLRHPHPTIGQRP